MGSRDRVGSDGASAHQRERGETEQPARHGPAWRALMAEVAGLPYAQQVERLRPPLPLLAGASPGPDLAVQMRDAPQGSPGEDTQPESSAEGDTDVHADLSAIDPAAVQARIAAIREALGQVAADAPIRAAGLVELATRVSRDLAEELTGVANGINDWARTEGEVLFERFGRDFAVQNMADPVDAAFFTLDFLPGVGEVSTVVDNLILRPITGTLAAARHNARLDDEVGDSVARIEALGADAGGVEAGLIRAFMREDTAVAYMLGSLASALLHRGDAASDQVDDLEAQAAAVQELGSGLASSPALSANLLREIAEGEYLVSDYRDFVSTIEAYEAALRSLPTQIEQLAQLAVNRAKDAFVAWIAGTGGDTTIYFQATLSRSGDAASDGPMDFRFFPLLSAVGPTPAADLGPQTCAHLRRPWRELQSMGLRLAVDVEIAIGRPGPEAGTITVERGRARMVQEPSGERRVEGEEARLFGDALKEPDLPAQARYARVVGYLWDFLDGER